MKRMMTRHRKPLTSSRWLGWVVCFSGVLGLAILAGVMFGAGRVSPGQLFPGGAELTDVQRTILFEVRVPRVLLAALLGGALTVAGVVFQALLRNPLADPYVLGVSGGASIGGVLALVLGAAQLLGGVAVPLFAFAGALGAGCPCGTVDGASDFNERDGRDAPSHASPRAVGHRGLLDRPAWPLGLQLIEFVSESRVNGGFGRPGRRPAPRATWRPGE